MTAKVIVLAREIDAGMDEVWRVLTDADRQSQMLNGVGDLEVVTVDPPQHAVMSGTLHHDRHHDAVRLSFALTPQRMHDSTRLVLTLREDINQRSMVGRAMWHTWGMLEYGHDRRMLTRDLEVIAHAAETLGRAAA